jgi:hypothetical protein
MRIALIAMIMTLPLTGAAAEFHLYGGLGLDVGGEKIIEVVYMDGSKDSIRAGEGFHIAVGSDIDLDERYMLRATVGYKVASISAQNGDISFRRVPLELTGYRFFGSHGIGAGVSHQRSVRLSCDFFGCGSVDVDPATGGIVEYLYRGRREDNNKGFSVGIRMGVIEYQGSGGGSSVRGNYIGGNIGITL